MTQHAFYLLFFFFITSCSQSQTSYTQQPSGEITPVISILSRPVPKVTDIDFDTSYSALKDSINHHRKSFYNHYIKAHPAKQKSIVDSAQEYLQKALVRNIFPYWYGTVWDFNGISNKPQQGFIACGYFVSTTLKHTGFNINRYKLAQQYSHSIVNTLCTGVHTFNSMQQMIMYVSQRSDQLYIVGLDNHVGFINKENGEIRFIHSSFVTPGYVISETVEKSLVLPSSARYVLGTVTLNEALVIKWMKGESINIIP